MGKGLENNLSAKTAYTNPGVGKNVVLPLPWVGFLRSGRLSGTDESGQL